MPERETEKVGIKATMVNHLFEYFSVFVRRALFSTSGLCHGFCGCCCFDPTMVLPKLIHLSLYSTSFSPVFVNLSFPFSIQTSITNITQKLQFQPNSALRSVKAQLGVQKNKGGPEGFASTHNSIHLFKSQLPSLKLTWPLKIEGWKMRFPFGMASKKKNRLPKNRRGFKLFFFWGGGNVHDPDCNRFTFSSDFS